MGLLLRTAETVKTILHVRVYTIRSRNELNNKDCYYLNIDQFLSSPTENSTEDLAAPS